MEHLIQKTDTESVSFFESDFIGRFTLTLAYITSVSKKSGQTAVVIHYCSLSSFFETDVE